jgi:hypothetical protein
MKLCEASWHDAIISCHGVKSKPTSPINKVFFHHSKQTIKQKAAVRKRERISSKGARRLRALKEKKYFHQSGTLQFKGNISMM